MFHHKEVPPYQHIRDNTFRPAAELENLREERKLEEAIRRYEHRDPVFSYVQGECPHLEKCDGLQKVWDMTTCNRGI